MRLKLPLLLAGALCVAFVASNVAIAHEGHDHGEAQATTVAEVKERIRGKLTEARKNACEARTKGISKILSNAATAGQRHLDLFNDIETKVETFFASKKSDTNAYQLAVVKAKLKRTDAQVAIINVKDAATTTIDCTGSDPIGQVDSFKDLVKAMHAALKDYRTAVKDVIVAAKQAPKATEEAQQ